MFQKVKSRHDIETLISERQFDSIGFKPLAFGKLPAGKAQSFRFNITAYDLAKFFKNRKIAAGAAAEIQQAKGRGLRAERGLETLQ